MKFIFLSFFSLLICLVNWVFSLEDFHAITIANKWRSELDILKQSAQMNGFDIEVLGLGQSWEGNGKKFLILREYIKDLPDTDIIFFVDAYDVFILAPKEKFLEAFKSKAFPIVCSAETNFSPKSLVGYLQDSYPTSHTSFKFLNSGSYIGYVWALRKMVAGIDEFKESANNISWAFSDQAHMQVFFMKNQDLVFLDRDAELFLTLHGVLTTDLKYDEINKKVYVKETKTCPLLVHGNGAIAKNFYLKISHLFLHNQNTFLEPLESFNYSSVIDSLVNGIINPFLYKTARK